MTRLLTTVALSALVLGAAAPARAQSGQPMPLGYYDAASTGHGAWPTDRDADRLNRGIADRNDDAAAINAYGSSGVTSSRTTITVAPPPPPTTTTTTTTTTYSRTTYPPPYPGAYR